MNAIAHYKWTLRTAAAYEKAKAAKEKAEAERLEAARREAERLEAAKAAEAAEIDATEIDADPEVAALLASARAHDAQTFHPCSNASYRKHCECCKSRVTVHLRDAIDEARERVLERVQAAKCNRVRAMQPLNNRTGV